MKIVGNTVGMGLPKPNLKQSDPKKGDFVKGKDEIPSKVSQLENDSGFLTDGYVVQDTAPSDTSVLWVDTSDDSNDGFQEAVNMALAQAKASGEFDGEKGDKGDPGGTGATGQRGTGLLAVTTAPSSYTTEVGGITPKYRMAVSTIKTQAGVTEVLLGDTVRYSYYHYPIAYLDASYAYFTTRVSIRGATGTAGTTPVKGTDYFTDADKAEMVNAVIAALPVYAGEVV